MIGGTRVTVVKTPASGSEDMPVIYIEVDGVPPSGTDWADEDVRAGHRTTKVVELARDVVEDAVVLAQGCAVRFRRGFDRLPGDTRPPDGIELQLGITLDSEVGAVLAKATAGAQLQLTLKWTAGT
jgi:hypothetical protein